MDTLKAIQTLARIRRENKLKYFQPYPWQKEIFEASSVYGERFLIAGNRVGKSEAAAYEVAIHATGDYPDWWTGYRYKKPPLIWCSGVTNESLRDITQKKLLGGVGEDVYGTGFIPKDRLSKPAMRQCGIAGVVESVKVKHKSGGYSDIVWKSYEQGWQKFQGAEVDLCIAEGQRVLMADGRMLPIEKVKPGDYVMSISKNSKRTARKVIAVHDKGEREIVEVKTKKGPWLRMTPDHEVYTSIRGKTPVAEAEKIYQIPSGWQPKNCFINFDDGYYVWAGLALSEGHYSSKKITMSDGPIIDLALKYLPPEATVRKKTYSNGHVPDWFLHWPDFWALINPGLAYEKKVPDWVYMSPNEKIKKLLGFMFSGDGWASGHGVGFASTSRVLAEDVVNLLWRLGIKAGVNIRRSKKEKWRDQYHVLISGADMVLKFADEIGIPGKEDALSKVVKEATRRTNSKSTRSNFKKSQAVSSGELKEYYREQSRKGRERYSKIKEISNAGVSRVYDLSVEVDHRFVVGSHLVSNCWLDEDPDDEQLFTEVLTRLITVKGLLLVTFTPLLGMTPLLRHIYDLGAKVYRKNVTWDETPHLTARDREEILSKYPEHERETRSKGIPMRGQGVVFPIPESRIKCAPFAIPSHWPQIIGIDFGWDHPNATVKCAYDSDNDVFYVTKASKRSKRTPLEHSAEIKAMGGGGITGWVPVSWPHDGINTEKSGETVKKQYEDHDINLIQFTARYDDDKGGGQSVEAIVMDVYERATTDRFKVFDTETLFFEEYRNYYRKDGKIVPIDDDILKAAFYALMMKRYAMPEYVARLSQTQPPEGAYI